MYASTQELLRVGLELGGARLNELCLAGATKYEGKLQPCWEWMSAARQSLRKAGQEHAAPAAHAPTGNKVSGAAAVEDAATNDGSSAAQSAGSNELEVAVRNVEKAALETVVGARAAEELVASGPVDVAKRLMDNALTEVLGDAKTTDMAASSADQAPTATHASGAAEEPKHHAEEHHQKHEGANAEDAAHHKHQEPKDHAEEHHQKHEHRDHEERTEPKHHTEEHHQKHEPHEHEEHTEEHHHKNQAGDVNEVAHAKHGAY